ncbi:H(+)-transporting V1 sector ATPase subunit A, partial [Mortierella sp. AD094]
GLESLDQSSVKVPWSCGWNDEDSDYDDFWPERSYSDTDSSENEYADGTEIDGTRFNTIPVTRQVCGFNQFGEMLGRAAVFGKPYLAQGDRERPTVEPTKDSSNTSNYLGPSHKRLASSSVFGILSASRGRVVSGKTIRSRGKTLTKGGKGQMSDLDDDDDSTTDPSSSEDDDAPDIDLGFAMNTRVFMADGTTKRIKNIQPGEYVLGPDHMPRLVIGTSIGRSPMIQVRELTQNAAHVSDSTLGLVTFTCTPKQSLRLATAQVQSVHVRHDVKRGFHTASFHRLKRVHDSMVVVHSAKMFQDTKTNAKQEADAFAHNR